MFPTEGELTDFIKKKNNLVNFSMIAKHFGIKNTTVSDMIASMEKKGIVSIKKLGGSKLVMARGK
ncbi:hypothetical protein J4231_02695 [Candidatus Woesearchaeota archaeon]|nr:hypothetical protein [Candidatus Woesearchaeota archaeon]